MIPTKELESTREVLMHEIGRITGMIRFKFPSLYSQMLSDKVILPDAGTELADEDLCDYLGYLNREFASYKEFAFS